MHYSELGRNTSLNWRRLPILSDIINHCALYKRLSRDVFQEIVSYLVIVFRKIYKMFPWYHLILFFKKTWSFLITVHRDLAKVNFSFYIMTSRNSQVSNLGKLMGHGCGCDQSPPIIHFWGKLDELRWGHHKAQWPTSAELFQEEISQLAKL